jgi:hypothetical protein
MMRVRHEDQVWLLYRIIEGGMCSYSFGMKKQTMHNVTEWFVLWCLLKRGDVWKNLFSNRQRKLIHNFNNFEIQFTIAHLHT